MLLLGKHLMNVRVADGYSQTGWFPFVAFKHRDNRLQEQISVETLSADASVLPGQSVPRESNGHRKYGRSDDVTVALSGPNLGRGDAQVSK